MIAGSGAARQSTRWGDLRAEHADQQRALARNVRLIFPRPRVFRSAKYLNG
jgi:hypothetical protein